MKKWKKRIPGMLILVAVVLNVLGRTYPIWIDGYVNYIFPLWTSTYGRMIGWFPFSVGEWMLYLAVVFLLLLIAGGIV
ncbi:MAG: DUF3810 family protein, partial [Firmicutes bacterium]|nr:DUF3810 family protein [Bacillota bacterium]